jgi:CheY-specific phosphatase CheX
VLRASDSNAVAGLVGSLRRLSLVLVNGESLRSDAVRLVGAIKERHPDLPVLWLQADRAAAPKKVDFVATDIEKLEGRLDRMVRETFYAPAFVRAVASGAQSVFADFGAPAQPSEPYIKSSLTSLSELTSFIFFYGEGLAGHVLLSATAGDVASIYRTQFPKTQTLGQDDIEDFLGELTNRIGGQIKRCVDPQTGEYRMGLPHFIRGVGTAFRYKAGTPALALDLVSDERKFQMELCLHRFDHGMIRAADSQSGMQSGVITFL